MQRWFTVTAITVLWCAACATVEKATVVPQVLEAQKAFDEGLSLQQAGKYAEAVPLVERALASWKAAFSERHPKVADCLDLLGELYLQQADNARAEPLLKHALEIRKATLGEGHPDVAASLNNLAYLYNQQGFQARAEPLYLQALKIREAAFGENHLSVAESLSNLANVYYRQELYARAQPLNERALKIQESLLGENHPDVARSLNNLATLYSKQDLYERAEVLHQRALGIWEATYGENHPLVAESLNNLAYLYYRQGFYARAEPLYVRALKIRETALGENHPKVADSLNNLASLYRHQGLYARAEPLYVRALAISEATLGEHHPDVAQSISNLGRLRLAQQNLGAALQLFERALLSSEQYLRQESFGFSEKNLTRFLDRFRFEENGLYALARAYPDNARVLQLALSAALLRKGRSVQEVANTSLIISRSLSPAERKDFERLRGLRAELATLSLAGPGSRAPADYQRQCKALASEGDALEEDLSRRSAPLRALTALPSATHIVGRVAQALPKDGALIELIAYEDRPLVPEPGTPEARVPSQLRYLALVLFPDARIRALDLGPAAPIDQAASSLRDALARRDFTFQALAQDFYQLAFKPLLPLLGDTRRLVLSPDGQVSLVPFAALHDGRQYLLDSFDFSYVTSGKDLLPRPSGLAPSNSVAVFADPDFSALPPPTAPALAEAPDVRSAPVEHFFSTLRANLAEQPWVPLPGTRQEAQLLQRLIPRAELFLGPDATKEQLLRLPTPGVLHIATHGFFLGDTSAAQEARAVGQFGALGDAPRGQLPADPLLRSGLVLAGAAAPASSGNAARPRDSSLITALELAGLDLWGTELVVLSACDTGRGDITLGQGVFGLRRALVVAGAETVVMSLWRINDDTTSKLMEAYYRNLLAGQGRAFALREAMRSLRATRPHPHYWAPFIALGRDEPLRALAPPQTLR